MPARLKWVPVAALAFALLAAPAFADATLTFVRKPLNPTVWVATDNGSQAHKLGAGTNPRVSPDGQTVAYSPLEGGSFSSELVVAPADGITPPRRLLDNWREPYEFDWSPDSSTIAALRGSELGKRALVLIDVTTGVQNVVAEGYFQGVSFAPDGSELVYARAASEGFPLRSDVYRFQIPIGQPLRYIPPVRITTDHRSLDPLWGPHGKIVFVKQLGAKQRRYGPKNELYLMNAAGKQVRRLTHTKVGPLLLGLSPTDWSSNGRRLLAQFGGQDTSYAVTVNPRTGAQHTLVGAGERGFIGTALDAAGKLVLGTIGAFEPTTHDVATVPYKDGTSNLLAKNAFEPDWNR